ncbi:hypothetical protein QTP88_028127 [Uroleucon formosanum]
MNSRFLRMDYRENSIGKSSRWDFPPDSQLPEQPSSRFINRFIRLKTTYWNRGYAVVLLGLIGIFVTALQLSIFYNFIWFMAQKNQIDFSHYDCLSYTVHGYYIGAVLGGVLATVYPAHNILGIFVTISSINQLIAVMSISYLNIHTHSFLQFLRGATMAVADTSFYRIWTYWVPLNKQYIRHVPIILSVWIYEGNYLHDSIDKLHNTNSSYTLTLFIGVIGLPWYVLWLYVINGNYSYRSLNRDFILFGGLHNSRYSFGTCSESFTQSIVSNIPWKSIWTSKPFLVIVLLYVCNARLSEINVYNIINVCDVLESTMRNYTIILLLLVVLLVELVPEITVTISTSNIRKFWSCSYFCLVGIFLILNEILGNSLRTNKICHYMIIEMQYLYSFGFYINILDIAPKYASLMYGLLLNIHFISNLLWVNVVDGILNSGILTEVQSAILMAIICFAVAAFYAIFASAEIQPWAADEPVEENQQNMKEWEEELHDWQKKTKINLQSIIITSLQLSAYDTFILFMNQSNKTENVYHDGYIDYNTLGYIIGLIPGGILATFYPAHNILGICVAISSIGHVIVILSISYLNGLTLCMLQLCIGTAMGFADVSIDRVWTYWVPLNKQSIRHVPMVLYMVIFEERYFHHTFDKLHSEHSSYTLNLFIGVIGLAWYVLWLYVVNGNYSFRSLNRDFILFGGLNNSRYSFGTYSESLTRSIVSDIPWKSIWTSKAFLVIVVLYECDAQILGTYYDSYLFGDYYFEWTLRDNTVVFLLLFVVLVELFPEITLPISTTNVRKIWSCLYFGSLGIIFFLEAILGNIIISNKICLYLFKEMRHFFNFGFYVNTLDIAPKYTSLLASFILFIHYYISDIFWANVVHPILTYAKLNEVETAIMMSIICFGAAVSYAIFASAELQPWADEPLEENQQNIVENDN